jgi:hypothetical protein
MRVFVCGAEKLTRPLRDEHEEEIYDDNTRRFYQVNQFLSFELMALLNAGHLHALGYDPEHGISCVLDSLYSSRVDVSRTTMAAVMAVFRPDLVMVIGGGLEPDPAQEEAIAGLLDQAAAAGILVRDAQNIG